MTREEWSDDELYECIKSYMQMLELERMGEQYNKSEFRRELLRGPLSKRSHGSIEFRMCNITAFRIGRGLDWVEGYKAREHIGINKEKQIERLFNRHEREK